MARLMDEREEIGVGMADMGPESEEQTARKRYTQISERNRCRFCRDAGGKVERIDYKDVLTLQKLCTSQGRIFSRKRSGNCARCQRLLQRAIKQARYIALMPYTA